MRKTILLLAALLCVTALLVACGRAPAAPAENSPTVEDAATEPALEPEPTPEPTPAPTPEPSTPAERAAALGLPEPPDVDIDSWEFKLANTYNGISEYHIPEYGGIEGQGIDPRIMDQTNALLQAARESGLKAYVAVAYRNFEHLFMLYQDMLARLGSAEAVAAAYPGAGCSEHQLGLGLDFTDDYAYSAYWYFFDNTGFEETELYHWLHEHCAEFGFIDRYPDDKRQFYGTPCTEGHFRYVGEAAARYIMENNICFEEFLMLYDPERVFLPAED